MASLTTNEQIASASGGLTCAPMLCVLVAWLPWSSAIAEPTPPAINFTEQIEPILRAHCFECHGATKQEAGLRLDVKAAALAGGDSGRAIVPGKSADSSLVERLTRDDADERMPLDKPSLADGQVALIKKWVDTGAPWPQGAQVGLIKTEHWAFQAIRGPTQPSVRNRSGTENQIDAFVLERLEREGINPSPPADRHVLIRRLSLDLTGLPPTPQEVAAFVSDLRPDAYQRLVDRLLASPHFGERWGRHWLDLARYADSDGYEMDHPRPHAWRWRDWVIDACNHDLPFDQFTIQQLAGDLLPGATILNRVATGFHRNTLTNRENGIDEEEFRLKAVADRVNTTGSVWLGLTLGCAECHSHKYDPITQREYYRFFAFFNDAVDEADVEVRPSLHELASLTPQRLRHAATLQELEAGFTDASGNERDKLAKAIEQHKKKAPQTISHVFAKRARPRSTHVHVRGNFLDKGAQVTAGPPAVLPPLERADDPGASHDRLDLARWIVDPSNPLTARVAVNHVWQHLFGAGLVATPEDFGTQGSPPSHPELLDWLATELVHKNWSRKALIKLIVTSSTYRQSSNHRLDLAERDPDNRLLARQNRFRLEAELVRDQYLAAGGTLVRSIGGPGFRPPLPDGLDKIGFRIAWKPDSGEVLNRRGMYIFYHRNLAYPMLKTFDHPNSNVACTRRERSNTPLQALTQLNDTQFVTAARALGRRLLSKAESPSARINRAFLLCLVREPRAGEQHVLLQHYQQLRAIYQDEPAAAKLLIGDGPVGAGGAVETAAWIAVARTIMNLDEFITRE